MSLLSGRVAVDMIFGTTTVYAQFSNKAGPNQDSAIGASPQTSSATRLDKELITEIENVQHVGMEKVRSGCSITQVSVSYTSVLAASKNLLYWTAVGEAEPAVQ